MLTHRGAVARAARDARRGGITVQVRFARRARRAVCRRLCRVHANCACAARRGRRRVQISRTLLTRTACRLPRRSLITRTACRALCRWIRVQVGITYAAVQTRRRPSGRIRPCIARTAIGADGPACRRWVRVVVDVASGALCAHGRLRRSVKAWLAQCARSAGVAVQISRPCCAHVA